MQRRRRYGPAITGRPAAPPVGASNQHVTWSPQRQFAARARARSNVARPWFFVRRRVAHCSRAYDPTSGPPPWRLRRGGGCAHGAIRGGVRLRVRLRLRLRLRVLAASVCGGVVPLLDRHEMQPIRVPRMRATANPAAAAPRRGPSRLLRPRGAVRQQQMLP